MRFLIYFICMIGVTSCCTPEKRICEGWEQKISSYDMSRIVIFFSARMKRDKHIELEDSKVYYDEKIKKIYLEYSSQEIIEMCEARLLLVEVMEDFLSVLNGHSVISHELAHHPFTPVDVDIQINFESFFVEYVDPLYIGLIYVKDGMATYYAGNIKDNHADWSSQVIEPYFKSKELALIKREADAAYAAPTPDTSHSRIIDELVP